MAASSPGSFSSVPSSGSGHPWFEQWGGKLAVFFTYTHLSHDMSTGLLAALLPFIRQDLGIDYLQAGFLVFAFALTSGLSQLLGGWTSTRVSRKKIIALGLGGVGLSTMAVSFTTSFFSLIAVLAAMGVLSGFYHPAAVSTLTDHFEKQRRGRVIALHQVGGSLGFGLGPFLGAIVAASFNWHLAFLVMGIPALVASPLVLLKLNLPVATVQSAETASPPAGNRNPVGVRQVLGSVLAIIVLTMTMQWVTRPIMSFVSLFMVDVRQLTEASASMWVSFARFGGLLGSLAGGWLSDKWGRRNTIFLALISLGPVIFLLTHLSFGIALTVVFILFGWLAQMRETTVQTYLMDKTPPRLRSTIYGIYFGFGQQGSNIIQPVAGDLMDMAGIASVFNTIAFITLGLSALAAITAVRMFRRKPAPITA